MPEGQKGRPGTKNGEKGHYIKVDPYEKFVPDEYKSRKKQK
jgi:hypothetical protein